MFNRPGILSRMGLASPRRMAPVNPPRQVAMAQPTPQIDPGAQNYASRLGMMARRQFADGGKVGVSTNLMKSVKDALDHLSNGDTASAKAALKNVPHPEAKAAQTDMNYGPAGVKKAVSKLEGLVENFSNREEVPFMAEGGKVTATARTIRNWVGELKNAVFGESDEPNWERAHAILDKKIPNSEKAKAKLSELQEHWNSDVGPDYDVSDDSHPVNQKTSKLVKELEDHIDSMTPGKRVPNPNE